MAERRAGRRRQGRRHPARERHRPERRRRSTSWPASASMSASRRSCREMRYPGSALGGSVEAALEHLTAALARRLAEWRRDGFETVRSGMARQGRPARARSRRQAGRRAGPRPVRRPGPRGRPAAGDAGRSAQDRVGRIAGPRGLGEIEGCCSPSMSAIPTSSSVSFDGDRIVGEWRAHTSAKRTADEYAVWLPQLMAMEGIDPKSINDAIIASVVPQANFNLRRLCTRYFNCEALFLGEPDFDLGIKVKGQEAGADRICNSVGASILFPKTPVLIVDFGTATNFDVADEEGNYCGGVIAPGIDLTIEAFSTETARLPRIIVEKPKQVIGKTTVACMHSGMFWGYVGLIESLDRAHPGRVRRADEGGFDRRPRACVRGSSSAVRCHRARSDVTRPAGDLASQQGMTVPSDDELLFLALGGAGEIGMNLNLYGHAGKWLMVDLGIAFGDDIDAGRRGHHARSRLHRGAAARTWSASCSPMPTRIISAPSPTSGRGSRAPVYATPFAASVLRRKLTRGRVCSIRCRSPRSRSAASSACRAVRARDDHHDAFDPRAQCAGDPHPVRHGVPYRRLEDRSGAVARRAHRRGDAEAHRRRGRARHGVRQHQRLRRGRGGLGSDGARQPREAGEGRARAASP